MKALVKQESKSGQWLADVSEPAVGINDVLLKALRTGICVPDLHVFDSLPYFAAGVCSFGCGIPLISSIIHLANPRVEFGSDSGPTGRKRPDSFGNVLR